MNRLLGTVIGLTWAIVSAIDLATRPGWIRSFVQSTEAVTSAVILVWPVSVSAGVAAAVRRRRSGLDERLETWPGNARARMAMGSTLTMLSRASAGAVLVFTIVGSAAVFTGSVPSPAALSGLGLALLGTAVVLAWGSVLGTMVPSYVVAALAPVALYLANWLLPAYASHDPLSFTGTTGLIGSAMRLDWWAMALFVTLFILSLVTAWAVQYLLTAGIAASTGRLRLLRAGAVGLLALITVVFHIGPTGPSLPAWTQQGMHAWDCSRINDDAEVCLPKDMRAVHDEYVRGMRIVADGLRPLVGKGRRLVISSATLPQQDPGTWYVMVETTFSPSAEEWAGSLAMQIATREGMAEVPSDECLARASAVAEHWERALEGRGAPPEAEDMRELIRLCRP